MRSSWLIAILFMLLVTAGGYWFYQNFSRVTESTEVGYQGDARYNPLLAAERFLNQKATPVKSMASLVGLPATNGTLVMPTQRYDRGTQQSQLLLDWVRAGGHLIVIPVETSPDRLLNRFGVSSIRKLGTTESYMPANVDIPQASEFLLVSFKSGTTLQARGAIPEFNSMDVAEGHMLRYQVGKGYLTVLSDAGFMQNSLIGHYDNAAFLWYLTHFQRQGEIWLIYSGDMPPLWKWLGNNAWTVLISAAVLLLSWLWSASHRTGPIFATPSLARRRLIDHIEASGGFLWQQGQRLKLLQGSRAALLRQLESRHPALATLPAGEIASQLAALSQSTPAAIHKALFDQYALNEHEFTAAISLLETIRKSL